MNGIIILDKPKGPTSNKISIFVKQMLKTKTGHCGTLDPNVTGVLPILLGNSIKLLEYLQEHDKEYVCLMKTEKAFPKETITDVLRSFEGKIYQRPPEMSAVAKNIRIRKIYEINVLETKENYVLFSVYCQHGTYIRKLVEDAGLVLGTATEMMELRRINSGSFKESECVTLTQLQDAVAMQDTKPELLAAMIHPAEYAIRKFAKAEVADSSVKNIQNGADVYRAGLKSLSGHIVKDTPIAIMNNDKLIAIGEALGNKNELLAKTNGAVIKTKKVIK